MGFCDLVARATSRNREIVRDAGVSFHFEAFGTSVMGNTYALESVVVIFAK